MASSAENRRRHWAARQQQNAAYGAKGVAVAWWEQACHVATECARGGDHSMWDDLVAALTTFCARHQAEASGKRAQNRLRHWEERMAALGDAAPRARALAWWDRARALAGDRADIEAWSDLARTVQNVCRRHAA